MARIAIPISNELLSNRFTECSYFKIFETDQQKVLSSKTEEFNETSLLLFSNWVSKEGITDFIVHSIDKELLLYFSDTKINLFLGVSVSSPEQLIDEYLKGTLKSNIQNIV